MNVYKDVTNFQEILDNVKKLATLGEIKELVEQIYPSWIIGFLQKYSQDYNELQSNWEKICQENKTNVKQIMLVDSIFFDDEHKLIQLFAEIFTKSGFLVRTKEQIIPCSKCNLAIISRQLYDLLKDKNSEDYPESWSDRCRSC